MILRTFIQAEVSVGVCMCIHEKCRSQEMVVRLNRVCMTSDRH